MSGELRIGEIDYISSKRAAQISGYAHDYIGQLCRSGVVEAQRIGGLWYLTLESLYKHKQKADSYVPVVPRREPTAEAQSVVAFDGKDYISTSRASEITGYHKDYVGQLARDGGLLSRQVGNRWFVDRESILTHKSVKDRLLGSVQSESVGLIRTSERKARCPESLTNSYDSGAGPYLEYTNDSGELLPTMITNREEPLAAPLAAVVEMPAAESREVAQTNIVNPRRSNLGIPSTVATPIHIRILPTARVIPRHTNGSHALRRMIRARSGAFVTGMATIVIFLALTALTAREDSMYTLNLEPARTQMTALTVNAGDILEVWASYLESLVVGQISYRRLDQ